MRVKRQRVYYVMVIGSDSVVMTIKKWGENIHKKPYLKFSAIILVVILVLLF